MPQAGRIKRIKNPDSPSQWIALRIPDAIDLRHGSGPIYRKERISFLNDDREHPTSRKVHAKTITHRASDPDGAPIAGADDPTQRVEVEVIDEFTLKHGSGQIYEKRTYVPNTDEDRATRATHIVRVHGTAEGGSADAWLDVRRLDRGTFVHGSGPTFKRLILEPDWNDAEFDAADVPVDAEDPDSGFDPPWRTDPLQDIVNVNWGGAILVVWRLHTSNFVFSTTSFPPCEPIDDPAAGGGETAVISWLQSFDLALDQISSADVVVSAPPSVSPSSASFGELEVFGTVSSSSPFRTEGFTAPFSLVGGIFTGQVCSGDPDPFTNPGELGTVRMLTDSADVFSGTISAAGTTATFNGHSYVAASMVTEARGLAGAPGPISVGILFTRVP